MTRPLFRETMVDLTARAERNRASIAELEFLRSELLHRSTQAARNLRASVEQQIAALKTTERRGVLPAVDEIELYLETHMDEQSTQLPEVPALTDPALRRLFEEARRRLVETGTRNRLVHVNRANARGNVLNIINERADDVFSLLSSGRKMRFLAIGKDVAKSNDNSDEGMQLFHAGDEGFDDARYGDNQLEVKLGPDALQKRLLKIAREAKTAEEEQGINILYIALGFMTWFEDKSSAVVREAPLVLLPVELKRNERTSTYDVQIRGDDIVTNLPLARRLKDDFGIELPEIETEDGWMPSDYFDRVDEVIGERDRWKIDEDGMQLGFFSFAKLLMYLDLDPERWPDGSLEKHGLVNGLLHEGFGGEEPSIGAEDRLDEILPPAAIFHVVDADASQTKVIEEVRRGRNLVVQGPPGTGKSQTITNIIATAAREGKSVLFVAEKMAALSVVHDRLVKTGLSDICLELHSKASNKKAVLAELGRTLAAAGTIPNVPGLPENLKGARDQLNVISAALHSQIGEADETPFTVLSRQSRYLGIGIKPPTLQADALCTMSRDEENALVEALVRIGELIADLGPPDAHPFRGVGKLDLQPVDLERLDQKLTMAAQALSKFQAKFDNIGSALGLDINCSFAATVHVLDLLARLDGIPDGVDGFIEIVMRVEDKPRLMETLTEGQGWRERFDAVQPFFIEAAFQSPAAHMRGPLVAGEGSFFARLGSAYRGASKELAGLLRDRLPKKAGERLALLDDLLDVQARHGRWNVDESFCDSELGDEWRGSRTNFALLNQSAQWAARLGDAEINVPTKAAISAAGSQVVLSSWCEQLANCADAAHTATDQALAVLALDADAFGDEGLQPVPLEAIITRIQAMATALPHYKKWAQYCQLTARLEKAGLGDLTSRMKSRLHHRRKRGDGTAFRAGGALVKSRPL